MTGAEYRAKYFIRYPVEGDDESFGEGECTCRRTGLGGNDPDAGWRRDRWCAVHGEDPDAARERRRDDGDF